ncbi:unnamed protein product, partial [Sphacelaria rigidula]
MNIDQHWKQCIHFQTLPLFRSTTTGIGFPSLGLYCPDVRRSRGEVGCLGSFSGGGMGSDLRERGHHHLQSNTNRHRLFASGADGGMSGAVADVRGGAGPEKRGHNSQGTLANSLTRNFIACFDVPLSQIRLTEFTRPLNDRGIDLMVKSITDKGWLPHAEPALVVDREGLPHGEFTEDCIPTAVYKVLDGNHRLAAAKKIMSAETRLRCRVHYAFDAAAMRVLGD